MIAEVLFEHLKTKLDTKYLIVFDTYIKIRHDLATFYLDFDDHALLLSVYRSFKTSSGIEIQYADPKLIEKIDNFIEKYTNESQI